LLQSEALKGLQGPTISPVYDMNHVGTAAQHGFYAATICVRKKKLYDAVKALQKVISPEMYPACFSLSSSKMPFCIPALTQT
jgi:hypothetical protein